MDADGHTPDTGHSLAPVFATTRFEQGVLTIRPAGPVIGQRDAKVIGEQVNRALAEAGADLRVLVFDLRDVQMMSSMALGVCIDARNHARQIGARPVMYAVSEQLGELFKMLRLSRLFTMARNEKHLRRLCR